MKNNRYFLLFAVLITLTMSCSLFSGGDDTNSSSPSTTDNKYLAEEYRSEIGGFSIQKVKDYEFNDVIGIVNMIAPGGNADVGPGIMVMGGLMDEDMTNDDLLDKMRQDSTAIKVLKEKEIKVNGVKGYSAEIEGTYDDEAVKGKIVAVMVTPRQEFLMLGTAPEEEWKDLSPVFDAVLGSVKFFEPTPDAETTMPEEEIPAVSEEGTASSGDEEAQPQAKPGEIRQWAISARASSEYGSQDWSAKQATGEPNVDECGDNVNAWASRGSNTVEWIELTYETAVYPTEINIFQTYNPSQVVEVQMIGTNGSKYIAWDGYPEEVEFCPDQMTITLDMFKKIKINKLRITIDQREMGWGWNEIDAVELVGTSDEAQSSSPQEQIDTVGSDSPADSGGPVPSNYTGWMAGKNYQGYAKIEIEKTMQKDLDALIGMKGKKSTENWKPRPDHKDTYIYDFGDGMNAYIGVLTNGKVYKKSITPNKYPKDFKLETVTRANYEKLDAIFKKDKVIPYPVMANLLKSPGFIRESYIADGKLKTMYEWYAPNGDKMSGFFLDGQLTGMAGLVFIPK